MSRAETEPSGAGSAAGPTQPTQRPSWPIFAGQAAFAGLMLVVEVYLYSLLSYTQDSHRATFAISIALSGLAVGGILSFWRKPSSFEQAVRSSSGWVGGLLLLHLFGVTVLPGSLAWTVVLMVPIFSAIAYVLSAAYRFAPAGRVFFFELQGAWVGAVAVYLLLDRLGLEATGVGAAALAFGAGLLGWREWLGRRRPPATVWGMILGAMLSLVTFVTLAVDPYFFLTQPVIEHQHGDEGDFLLSRPGFEGRLDAFSIGGAIAFYVDGSLQDHISYAPRQVWEHDPRLPAALFEAPRIFVIGASIQGILHAAKAIPGAEIVGVELNEAIVDLARGEYFDTSRRAYEGVEIEVAEGRSYLLRDGHRDDGPWDVITLLSGYPNTSPYSPDYLHTVEAIDLYYERLSERGVVVLEEWVVDNEGAVRGLKLMATLRQSLLARGVERPAAGLLVYFWGFGGSYPYLQVLAREEPFTEAELSRLDEFFDRMAGVTDYELEWVHRPDQALDNDLTRFVETGELPEHFVAAGYAVWPTTDDRPFPRQVTDSYDELDRMMIGALAIFGLLIALAALVHRQRFPDEPAGGVVARYSFFVSLGLALLLFEFHFIHAYQLLVGRPSWVFVIALVGLLAGGSLGALLAHRFRLDRVLWLMVLLLIAVLVAENAARSALVGLAAGLSVELRVLLTIGLAAAPGVLHGTLFPTAMRQVRDDEAHASGVSLYYGVSGLASVLASVFAIVVSVRLGFDATFSLALVAYGLVLVCSLVMAPKAGRPAS